MKKDAIEIFLHAVDAANPILAINGKISLDGKRALIVKDRTYDLNRYENIYLVGAGKASALMGQAAGHPIPDSMGMEGTKRIVNLLHSAKEKDLVICLISGGGSALLTLPVDGITLGDKQKITELLLGCGATIDEINAIRKHISRVKGGELARIAYPAAVITLMISDVVGDRMDVIASGPTVTDASTFEDCMNILNKYGLRNITPVPIIRRMEDGIRGEIKETLKDSDDIVKNVQNLIIGGNIFSIKAAEKKANELGYNTLVLSSYIEGETRVVAKLHVAIVKEVLNSGNPVRSLHVLFPVERPQ